MFNTLAACIKNGIHFLACDCCDSARPFSFPRTEFLVVNNHITNSLAWKAEGSGTVAAIAGKKMYAVFDASGKCIKHACKGVDLTPEQIRGVARGDEIITWKEAPTFKLDGSATFLHRTSRLT